MVRASRGGCRGVIVVAPSQSYARGIDHHVFMDVETLVGGSGPVASPGGRAAHLAVESSGRPPTRPYGYEQATLRQIEAVFSTAGLRADTRRR